MLIYSIGYIFYLNARDIKKWQTRIKGGANMALDLGELRKIKSKNKETTKVVPDGTEVEQEETPTEETEEEETPEDTEEEDAEEKDEVLTIENQNGTRNKEQIVWIALRPKHLIEIGLEGVVVTTDVIKAVKKDLGITIEPKKTAKKGVAADGGNKVANAIAAITGNSALSDKDKAKLIKALV